MQTSFSNPGVIGFPGQWAYLLGPKEADSGKAVRAIEFGRRLSYTGNNNSSLDMVGTNKVTLTNSGNLDASDTYSFTLKCTNLSTGVETEHSLSATFSSSDSATMGTIVTALELLDEIDDSGTAYANNVLTIVAADGYIIEVSGQVTGGGSTVTIIKANFDTRRRAGFAGFLDKEPFLDTDGTTEISRWKPNEILSNKLKGNVIVESVTGFAPSDSALYIVGYGANRGKIDNAAGNNGIAVSDITVRASASANGKGIVSIDI